MILMARNKILEKTEVIFSDAQLLLFANQSKDDIALKAPNQDHLTMTTLGFVAGLATKPTDFQTHYLTKDSSTPGVGNEYFWMNIKDFQKGVATTGLTRLISQMGSNLQIFPVENKTLYTWYYKKLPDMALADVCPLQQGFQEACMYGIVYRAFEDLQDFELGKYFETIYKTKIIEKGRDISLSDENSRNNGALFNGIQII